MYSNVFKNVAVAKPVTKFNPFHDEVGRFTDSSKPAFVSTGPKFASFLRRVRGTHMGENKGGGYSGKVAAGLASVLGVRPNKDHKLVTGMKSHTVDVNPKSKEEFNKAKEDIHQVLSLNGFKSKGQRIEGKEDMRTEYEHKNGALAVVEHMDQSLSKASKFIGVEIFHGKLPPKKANSNPYARKADEEVLDSDLFDMDSLLISLTEVSKTMLDIHVPAGFSHIFKGAPLENPKSSEASDSRP